MKRLLTLLLAAAGTFALTMGTRQSMGLFLGLGASGFLYFPDAGEGADD